MPVRLPNFLLSRLDPDDLAALSPGLADIELAAGDVLFGPGQQPEAVYFPTGACISIVTILADGRSVEIGAIGHESAAGLNEAATHRPATTRCFTQIGGPATRLPAALYRARMLQSPTLAELTLLHLRASAVQAEQGVACNAAHEVSARLSRWLLMTQDRAGSATFPLTQDHMAVMTGVQRSTVSLAAGALKKRGVIDYSRGSVAIRDRDALQRHACECYAIMAAQFDSLRAPSLA
jgi:CRP-like cAMP-binding protein